MFQDGHLDYYTLRKYYERDAAYLGLIKAFLQDCPQLILQLYILAVRDHKTLNEPSIGKNHLLALEQRFKKTKNQRLVHYMISVHRKCVKLVL